MGTAGALEYQREDFAVASGGVDVKFQDYEIRAETATVDLASKTLTAHGNVIVDQGPRRLAGDSLTFDLDAKTGTMQNATAYLEPDIYFSGKEISKIAENSYTVVDGVFTSCTGDVPAWSFSLSRAQVDV